ncbi:2-C-methyl-D-erythritol 2,4-cyclodiphosphate synthase [Roseimaritima sediminicola]|uniref:2-C-methyl-D-erythritol 2,4-cyclodiphosphate synthase n=1 Tax=Roseimaritima sediminicola TaxID=2662066 RepID=UPI0012984385|nr:2-C-methyl-D-erythritol 2,4-cyclodiphosphate synthase [Roseimaritima sediminicola]
MHAPPIRIGLGFDTHRLGNGGPLRLGGIDLPADVHAIGHSDADVLLHAITDAILGAGDAGDIGRLFPDTAEENRGRNSGEFLSEALRRVRAKGWEVVNLDCVVLAQQPKIAPHLDKMRQSISEIANLSPTQVGIKGKTGEGVGPIGHAEAVAARCVVLLYRCD